MEVDDYDRFDRTYKVVMQFDVYFCGEVDMLKFNTGTTQVTRFNGKRSVLIQAQPASGYFSGQAMTALTNVVYEVAPTGFGVGNPVFQNNTYMQISFMMIMRLAAKNAILIVEFAKVHTDKGMEAVKASLE